MTAAVYKPEAEGAAEEAVAVYKPEPEMLVGAVVAYKPEPEEEEAAKFQEEAAFATAVGR
jgi:predicted aconitase with swiveling domain